MVINESIGKSIIKEWNVSFKDYILYALGVGTAMEKNNLRFIYEKDLQIIPSFASLAYNLTDENPYMQVVKDHLGMLHASNELEILHPFPSAGGRLKFRQTLADVYDMGDKGAQFVSVTEVFSEDGTLLSRAKDIEFARGEGGFGGKPRPADTFPVIPDRDPDVYRKDRIPDGQYYLFRLCGDYYPLHADPEFARAYGFKAPIMHGLATYGYACRMAMEELFPGEAERMTSIKGRFKNPVYAGVQIGLKIWRDGAGRALWQLVDESTGRIVIDKGEICWK